MSWIRRRDWHILSAGDAVFTQDQRFKLHREGSDGSKWTLMIKNLNEEDEGTYVCQVGNLGILFLITHIYVNDNLSPTLRADPGED